MILFTTDRWTVNLDHMVDYELNLAYINQSLANGDIYDVEIIINMVDGSCYNVKDTKSQMKFLETLNNTGTGIARTYDSKDAWYYVCKKIDYDKAKDGKKK